MGGFFLITVYFAHLLMSSLHFVSSSFAKMLSTSSCSLRALASQTMLRIFSKLASLRCFAVLRTADVHQQHVVAAATSKFSLPRSKFNFSLNSLRYRCSSQSNASLMLHSLRSLR